MVLMLLLSTGRSNAVSRVKDTIGERGAWRQAMVNGSPFSWMEKQAYESFFDCIHYRLLMIFLGYPGCLKSVWPLGVGRHAYAFKSLDRW